MTEWILDREHPLKGVLRGVSLIVAMIPVITAVVLLLK